MKSASTIQAEELEKIRVNSNGVVKPRAVVDAAKPETAPLHRFFEWDNNVAGDEHRLEQARRMIRARMSTPTPTSPRPVRAYAHVSDCGERGYMKMDDVLADTDLRQEHHRRLINEMMSCILRLRAFEHVAGVDRCIAVLQEVLDDLQGASAASGGVP